MSEILFPSMDIDDNFTTSIYARDHVFLDARTKISMQFEGVDVPIRPYAKLVLIRFDEKPLVAEATNRKNWRILTRTGQTIVPDSVSMVSERTVAVAVNLSPHEQYVFQYTMSDNFGSQTTGSVDCIGI